MAIQSNFPNLKPTLLLDFANVKALDPRITFTRASTGTYYDGKTVAKAEENLVTYSQEFDNATGWPFLSNVAVAANTTIAPDGTTTADTLTFNGGGASCRIARNITASALDTTRSVFVRAGTTSFVQFLSAGDGTAFANFDVSAGTVGTVGSGVTASIVNFGGGWYRIVMTFAKSGAIEFRIQGIDSSTAAYGASMTTGGTVFLWGAQLEQRSAVTAYTPTTTQPITNYIPVLQTAAAGVARFDHNPTTDESLGLLIEEQRTNLVTYSEVFSNVAWTKTRTSITANTVIAPDGTLTGDKLVEDTSASTSHLILQSTTQTKNATYTFSFYAKAAERTFCRVFLNGYSGNNIRASFNLTTGAVSATGFGGNGSFSSAFAVSVGNGWFRCSLVGIPSASAGTGFDTQINLAIDGTVNGDSYTGDGYSGIYIWGAQLEAGAFPTSYIPTVAAQVTRSADLALMTGTNFSSWYAADQGTMYVEYARNGLSSASSPFDINDNTTTNVIRFVSGFGNPAQQRFDVIANNVTNAVSFANGVVGTFYKAAAAYSFNDIAGSQNAGTVLTNSTAIIPTVTQTRIGSAQGASVLNGTIRKIAYYPIRVTNAQLQALTS